MTYMHTWLTATYDHDDFSLFLFSFPLYGAGAGCSVLYSNYILSVVQNYLSTGKKSIGVGCLSVSGGWTVLMPA
jgi:hypothetical protein